MTPYKILFFPRYSSPFSAVPYSKEVDFECDNVKEATDFLKKSTDDFARERHYMLHDVKGYLLKSKGQNKWQWIKVAARDSDSRSPKVYNLGGKHTEDSDPTISSMNLGRRF